jgi:hypothetical protein
MVRSATPRSAAPSERAALDAFQKLVQSVELLAVNLVSSESRWHASNPNPGTDQFEIRPHTTQQRVQFDEEQHVLYCGVKFGIDVVPETTKKPFITVTAEYALLYRVPEGTECPPELANAFASRNAVFNAWPFFRELTQSLVSRMGMAPLILALLRLPPGPPAVVSPKR